MSFYYLNSINFFLKQPNFYVRPFKKCNQLDKNIKLGVFVTEKDLNNAKSEELFTDFFTTLTSNRINPKDVYVSIEEGKHSDKTWAKFKQLNQKWSKAGYKFGVIDIDYFWTIPEVENANSQLKDVSNNIRSHNFSPLENLLNAYLTVKSKEYKKAEESEHASHSRSLYSVLNSDQIVCAGYNSLLISIMERVDDKNIKLFYNSVDVSKNGVDISSHHANLVVYIKDDKYKIDGYYYIDTTWDSGVTKALNFFMVPINDIKNINTYIFNRNVKDVLSIASDKNTFDMNFFESLCKHPFVKEYASQKLRPNATDLEINHYIWQNKDDVMEFVSKYSEPLDMDTIRKALYQVGLKNNPNKTKEAIFKMCNEFMNYNIKRATKIFNKNSINTFATAGHFKTLEQEK